MFPSNIKSLKIRRLLSRYKNFRIRARKTFKNVKSSTKEKLSRARKSFGFFVKVSIGHLPDTSSPKKEKPHPLEGVKIKYEQVPITKMLR